MSLSSTLTGRWMITIYLLLLAGLNHSLLLTSPITFGIIGGVLLIIAVIFLGYSGYGIDENDYVGAQSIAFWAFVTGLLLVVVEVSLPFGAHVRINHEVVATGSEVISTLFADISSRMFTGVFILGGLAFFGFVVLAVYHMASSYSTHRSIDGEKREE